MNFREKMECLVERLLEIGKHMGAACTSGPDGNEKLKSFKRSQVMFTFAFSRFND